MGAENKYPTIDEVTPHQWQKIKELREKAADILKIYEGYESDFTLLRWLMEYDYNVEDILPKLKYALEALVAVGADKYHVDDEHDLNAASRTLTPLAEYFPGGIMGFSRNGDPVGMQRTAGASPKTIIKSARDSEMMKFALIEIDMISKLLKKQEALHRRKLGTYLIFDMDGFTMDHIHKPSLKIFMNRVAMLQTVFPSGSVRTIIINAPMLINTIFALVSPVLSKNLKETIRFLGSDWKDALDKEIGLENMYPRWGGSKDGNGCDTADLRMGGHVPEKLWYNSENNEFDKKEHMTKITVSARSCSEENIDSDKILTQTMHKQTDTEMVRIKGVAGKHIEYLWRCSSGDLEFHVECNNKMIFPRMKLATEFVPDWGRFACDSDGEYVFYFDNSHGKMFSKDVKYRIELV